jgi:predicted acetyltransferase
MDLEIRSVSPDELGTFVETGERAEDGQVDAHYVEGMKALLDPARCLAAFERGRMVGTAGELALQLTVPGATLPVAAVTEVAVVPTHRRRGVLTRLKRRELEVMRERGEQVAALWASEGAIYGRFGYGLASLSCAIKVDRRLVRMLDGPSGAHSGEAGTLEVGSFGELSGDMGAVYERVRPTRPGFVDRDGPWWPFLVEHWAAYEPEQGPLQFVSHRVDGDPGGYLIFRQRSRWNAGLPENELTVLELVAATPAAYRDLWRFVLSMDLTATVRAPHVAVDEPLLHMVDEPRRLFLTVRDGVWVRLVDVAGALASRRYARAGSVVLEVSDAFCPWNEGRVRLEAGEDGSAACARTTDEPDLGLSAAELGAAYLGGTRLGTLAGAGRVRELNPGGLARADAMFAWAPAPWCPHIF